jgi:hypothetical protein
MTQSSLNERQLLELDEIVELAKITEQQSQELCDAAIAVSKKFKVRKQQATPEQVKMPG